MGRQYRWHRGGYRAGVRRKKLTDALRWQLAWGENLEFLEGLAAQGEDVPALNERVFVQDHLQSVWRAYHALRTDRQVGMDMGPIMFSSIDRYARRYKINDLDEFERFTVLVRALDHAERNFKV